MPDEADIIVVAQAIGRLGKRYIVEGNTYLKPSGDEREVNIGQDGVFRFNIIEGVDSLDKIYELRKHLSKATDASIVLGHPTEAMHDAVNEVKEDHEDKTTTYTTKYLPRSEKYLVDGASRFLVLDVDELEVEDYDAVADAPDTINRLYELFDEWGLDWLLADCVIQLSSSHGLMKRNAIKAHVTFELEKPLTLEEQKAVAGYINDKAKQTVVDVAVYEPRRLLFTSEAEYLKRGVTSTRLFRLKPPHLFATRVLRASKGQRYCEVPEEALDYIDVEEHIARITGTAVTTTDMTLRPGNVHNYIRNVIHGVVANTEPHLLAQKKIELKERFLGQVRAMPDFEKKKASRESIAAGKAFEAAWRGSERKFNVKTKLGEASKSDTNIVKARQQNAELIQKLTDNAINEHAKSEGDGFYIRVPTHTLIKAPPGIGKSEQMLASVRPEYLDDARILALAPTAKLSTELRERMLEKKGDENSVRLHLGRAKWCTADEETQKKAEAIEALGLSPYEAVCTLCSHHNECLWVKQRQDKEPGFITTQHANLSTTYRNMSRDKVPAMTFVDEAFFSQVIPEATIYKPETIDKIISDTTVLKADGTTSTYRTTDLQAQRRALIDALTNTGPAVPLSSLSSLVKVLDRKNTNKLTYHEAEERHVRESWQSNANKVVEAIKAEGHSKKLEEKLKRAADQMRACDWFLELIDIVRASFDVPGRKIVFGIVNHDGKISSCKRRPLPDSITGSDGVYLDGTADADVFKACLHGENARVVEIDVRPEHYVLTQVFDKPFGKSMFLQNKASGKTDSANIHQLKLFIIKKAREHKDLLVVCQMEVQLKLEEMGGIPENVAMEHFNNLRGRDEYKDYEAAIVVGRPAPPRASLELMTQALHYDNDDVRELKSVDDGYYAEDVELPMRGGRVLPIKAESHPDPNVKAMMRQILEAEVRQAVMRLRLFNRTADNPAHLYVLGQTDTGLEIDHAVRWDAIKTTSAGACGIVTQSPYLCDLIGETMGRSGERVRKQMADVYKGTDAPVHKLRVNGKLVRVKTADPAGTAALIEEMQNVTEVTPA
jgi:hypothetical protein